MTTQLLLYETVVPLSFGRHRDSSVEIGSNYSFSGKVNSVPLMAVEFPETAADYAIVFAGTKENIMPVVILGLRGNENLYLSKDATWEAKYIPAFALAVEAPAFIALYRSRSGFAGVDAMTLSIKYPGGKTEIQRISVTVGTAEEEFSASSPFPDDPDGLWPFLGAAFSQPHQATMPNAHNAVIADLG